MVRYRVIHNNKLAWSPSVGTLILSHKARDVVKDLTWHQSVISKDNSFLWVVSRIDPPSVRGNDLVEEGFVSVR